MPESASAETDFEPITIRRMIPEEVGRPRNDGTPGSALYKVVFQLSRAAPSDWAQHFAATWDRPPQWTSAHRSGICTVRGDRVFLDGTTVEEVEKTHAATLKIVAEKVNQDYSQHLRDTAHKAARSAEREAREREEHEARVREVNERLKFD